MTISYDAELEDFAQPSIRHFLRSETAVRARRTRALTWALIYGAVAGFLFRNWAPIGTITAALIGAALGALCGFSTYKGAAGNGIRAHIARELRGRLPIRTEWIIDDEAVTIEYAEATIRFQLADLERITEDPPHLQFPGWLEINFGRKGLGTVPLRVFKSDSEKAAFIAALRKTSGSRPTDAIRS
jgi:hypothetical protein